MSRDQEDVASQPLVIVRRRRNPDEAHHGGVWKIAYADFMTAMMAFFLVMWLVNAADKKTIVQVAAYFNPIRLTDRFAAPKGLDDLTETQSKPSEQRNKKGFLKEMIDEKQKQEADRESKENTSEAIDEAAQKSSAAAGGKSSEVQKEQALFDNPGDVLDKLADEAKASQLTTSGSPSVGSDGDPFDRVKRKSGKSQAAATKQVPQATPVEPSKSSEAATSQGQAARPAGADGGRKDAGQREAAKIPGPETSKPPVSDLAKPPALPPVASKDEAPRDKEAEAKKIESDISNAISKVSKELPKVEVKSTPEGLLISLLDDAKFGMFEVGSAKPRPELVLVMDKVGEILQGMSGKLVVRGHTDSRAYKSGVYDNWRLSAARAQMAYYMLVRSGLPEARVVAIEGRADRDPKLPSDTTAAPNRRIDILVKEDK